MSAFLYWRLSALDVALIAPHQPSTTAANQKSPFL